jgi:hypothetical protein
MPHVLIPAEFRERLLANGAKSAAGEDIDPVPVVKLFTPDANATWLLTELDPDNPTLAFGLCDLGLGSPELGSTAAHLACLLSATSIIQRQERLALSPTWRDVRGT